MKQSAVDFLISHLQKSKDFQRVLNEVSQMSTIEFDLIKEANSIFEKQIINAWNSCGESIITEEFDNAQQYYNKTFGK